jgi:hypothetical protein
MQILLLDFWKVKLCNKKERKVKQESLQYKENKQQKKQPVYQKKQTDELNYKKRKRFDCS